MLVIITWHVYRGKVIPRPLGASPSCSTASEWSKCTALAESRTFEAVRCVISFSKSLNTLFRNPVSRQ